jgi:hypothetical protein
MAPNFQAAWQQQIEWCDGNGSPFTARVLEAALADWHAGGALRQLLPAWPGDARIDALALRVAGALHAIALDGSDPALTALYPPQRDTFDAARGAAAVSAALRRHAARVATHLQSAPQTNEIGRSALLLGGLARIARNSGLPLATLEIGASAGLNSLWHAYRYELGAQQRWGDPASSVCIRSDWQGATPRLPARIDIASQAACDVAPIDLRAPGAALHLAAYVWPDQTERLARLRAAIGLAQRSALRVERADALAWSERALALPRPGQATVLMHSVMWQYMPAPTRDALRACIAAAGARATRQAPLAWLAYEPPDGGAICELTLTEWPGGARRRLARGHPHGLWAHWVADDALPTAPGP